MKLARKLLMVIFKVPRSTSSLPLFIFLLTFYLSPVHAWMSSATTPSNATVVSMSLRASARCRCVPQPGARSHSGSGRTHHLQEALILRPLEDMTGDDLGCIKSACFMGFPPASATCLWPLPCNQTKSHQTAGLELCCPTTSHP